MALISISGLRRYFRMGNTIVRALDGVDLTVEVGEFLCLMGPSGSGKSTLLNLLGGLDSPDEGSITVGAWEMAQLDQNGLADYRRDRVGFVFQSYNLIPTMTALQNVEYPMIFAGIPRQRRQKRAAELLAAVGLKDRLNHRPTEMSGGQQQRVAIARSLVNRPTILLCDEPTGNLDTRTGEEILTLFTRLNQDGQTLIVVTHDPRVAGYASRTVHMLDGRIISDNNRSHKDLHPYG